MAVKQLEDREEDRLLLLGGQDNGFRQAEAAFDGLLAGFAGLEGLLNAATLPLYGDLLAVDENIDADNCEGAIVNIG